MVSQEVVTLAKGGVQRNCNSLKFLDFGFQRNPEMVFFWLLQDYQSFEVVLNFTRVVLNSVDIRNDVGNIYSDMVTMMYTINCQAMLARIGMMWKM